MNSFAISKQKIGVICAAFITTPIHFQMSVQTVLSLYGLPTSLELFPVVVVNACTTGANDLAWFMTSFDRCIINDRNNLARAWNRGIKECLSAECRYILVLNLDLLFHPQFLNNLVLFASEQSEAIMWSGMTWPDQFSLGDAALIGEPVRSIDTSCFMFDRRLIDLVGYFDEQFEPAYHEDKDMLYRIRLAGQYAISTPRARFFHHGQGTLKASSLASQEEFLAMIRQRMNEGMVRYENKWGGLPGEERFTVPYDGKKSE